MKVVDGHGSGLRRWSIILSFTSLLSTSLSCSETTQARIATIAVESGATALAEGMSFTATQVIQLRETALAELATQVSQSKPSPWDVDWIPSDSLRVSHRINEILNDTGLEGSGDAILEYSRDYGVNPAFCLAMFRKEAVFARHDFRAYRNNNPGNIIATGECRGLPNGSSCNGIYGEISTDGRFGVYPSMEDGIKAYYLLLNNEYGPGSHRDCVDIPCVISAYCPPSECDTDTYISQISNWTREYQLTHIPHS